jgi:hypothetical protein
MAMTIEYAAGISTVQRIVFPCGLRCFGIRWFSVPSILRQ